MHVNVRLQNIGTSDRYLLPRRPFGFAHVTLAGHGLWKQETLEGPSANNSHRNTLRWGVGYWPSLRAALSDDGDLTESAERVEMAFGGGAQADNFRPTSVATTLKKFWLFPGLVECGGEDVDLLLCAASPTLPAADEQAGLEAQLHCSQNREFIEPLREGLLRAADAFPSAFDPTVFVDACNCGLIPKKLVGTLNEGLPRAPIIMVESADLQTSYASGTWLHGARKEPASGGGGDHSRGKAALMFKSNAEVLYRMAGDAPGKYYRQNRSEQSADAAIGRFQSEIGGSVVDTA